MLYCCCDLQEHPRVLLLFGSNSYPSRYWCDCGIHIMGKQNDLSCRRRFRRESSNKMILRWTIIAKRRDITVLMRRDECTQYRKWHMEIWAKGWRNWRITCFERLIKYDIIEGLNNAMMVTGSHVRSVYDEINACHDQVKGNSNNFS